MLKKSSVLGGKIKPPTNYKPCYGANVGAGGGGGNAMNVPFSGMGTRPALANKLRPATSYDNYMRKPK